ncbi:MAG: DNA translocase FtsK [Chloroflexi bacterium]|uniref:DNA translocase FtsK n=1 Tax=Candidatus Chlorohelix allophototropha TaxID=3003348 RepID=A0A8T7MA76_9CHLR|nr:DNA translocase FtsK [Chloroflexota bacterium]WJW68893.1 DUF87 domain-containing protein [Chloroflexota bacterium L227-S17]
MRSLLDHQADGIEYTLHSHNIEGSVVGGNISPRLIQFHVKLASGVKYSRVTNLADEIALALGVHSCRITRDGYFVKVEVPRPDPVAVQLFPLMRTLPADLPTHSPILGLDENGVPLLVRLTSPDIAHVLISGTTGSGKTALARSMIASLALQNPPEQLRMLLIDPKSRGYKHFNGLPNLVCPVITDPTDGLHRLKWAVRHMEKRDETGVSSPVLAIFIDELADLLMVNGREMEQLVTRITQRGREAGIHLIASTQKPAASVIGGIAKSNFPTRIVGKVVSPEDARVASGVAGSGAEKLMGRGDFLLFSGNISTRLQGAYISNAEMEQTVVHLGGTLEQTRPSRPKRETVVQEEYETPYVPTPNYLSRREIRTETQPAPSYRDYGYDEQAMGVSERFENYQQGIGKRRRVAELKAEYPRMDSNYDYRDEDEEVRTVAKPQPQPARQVDLWDEEKPQPKTVAQPPRPLPRVAPSQPTNPRNYETTRRTSSQ